MTQNAYDLAQKVAFITGGNDGIGSATARESFKRGARVVIADVDPSTPLRAFELGADKALGCVADVRDSASLDGAVTRTIDRFGRLDVVIANAGLLAKAATLRNTPIADLEATLAVNVTGVAHTVAAAMESVIAGRGQIVLISSVFAFINGMGPLSPAARRVLLSTPQAGAAGRRDLAAARSVREGATTSTTRRPEGRVSELQLDVALSWSRSARPR